MEMIVESNNGIQSLEVFFFYRALTQSSFENSACVAIDGRETTFFAVVFVWKSNVMSTIVVIARQRLICLR